MKIKNYYIHHGVEMVEADLQQIKFIQINKVLEQENNKEDSVIFRVKDTDIVFRVDDFAGITEDEEEVSIHMGCEEEIEAVARTLRINKKTYEIVLTNMQRMSYLSLNRYAICGGDLDDYLGLTEN